MKNLRDTISHSVWDYVSASRWFSIKPTVKHSIIVDSVKDSIGDPMESIISMLRDSAKEDMQL